MTRVQRWMCAAAGLIAVTALATAWRPAPPQGTVQLALANTSNIDGKAFAGDVTHSIAISTAQGEITVERDYRVRFSLGTPRATQGDSVSVLARLDSVRGAAVVHGSRQVINPRHLLRTTVPLTYARSGGPPRYHTEPPAVDYGHSLGGPIPASIVMDYAFPVMPTRPVRAGERWQGSWVRRQVDGSVVTERRLTGTFSLARVDRHDGVALARIEMTARGEGSLESTGVVLIGVDDGIVREVSVQETASGSSVFAGGERRFRQTTNVRLREVPNR